MSIINLLLFLKRGVVFPHFFCILSYLLRLLFFRRKKFPGQCRWRSQTIIDSMEHYEGCQDFRFGNPNFVRLTSGSCNNLTPNRQHYGLVSLPFTRLQPADYAGMYKVG